MSGSLSSSLSVGGPASGVIMAPQEQSHAPIEINGGSAIDFTWHQKYALTRELWCLQFNETIWINCNWRYPCFPDQFFYQFRQQLPDFKASQVKERKFLCRNIWRVFISGSSTVWWIFKSFFNILSSTQYSKAQEFKTQCSNKTEFESALMADIQQFA